MSNSNFERAVSTADDWVRSVAAEFETDDLGFVHRALRAWLHGLRDELSVEACAHFAAQLPELLRGVWYEGWDPSRVPVEHDVDAYVSRFAREAQVRPTEVRHVASTVTAGLHHRMPATQLAAAFEQLPQRLRELVWSAPRVTSGPAVASRPELPDRLSRLEEQVGRLTDAVGELVQGLEHIPVDDVPERRADEAAHRAHQILLSGRA